MILKVPPNSKHSVILWFYQMMLTIYDKPPGALKNFYVTRQQTINYGSTNTSYIRVLTEAI